MMGSMIQCNNLKTSDGKRRFRKTADMSAKWSSKNVRRTFHETVNVIDYYHWNFSLQYHWSKIKNGGYTLLQHVEVATRAGRSITIYENTEGTSYPKPM